MHQSLASSIVKDGTNYQYGHPGMYGSNIHATQSMQQKGPFLRGERQRLNIVAILISLFLPWLIFCLVFWVVSFSLHYKNPFVCYVIMFLALSAVLVIAYFAFEAIRKKTKDKFHEPTWLFFLFITSFLAWLLGVIAGDINFYHYMEPYYDVTNLNTYDSVDPSRMRGQQLMDAGRVMFAPSSQLDLSRSMGFKNLELYCVAPIVGGNDPRHMPTYDFWAVGMNCCSGNRADFHCGEFNQNQASAGLRLMRDDQRAFYRLAVQQAEAAYNIRADHPLFFYWMHDPIEEVNAWMDEGIKNYMLGIMTHFIFQLFLVCAASIAFSKLVGGLY
jgi:hypothetical protein